VKTQQLIRLGKIYTRDLAEEILISKMDNLILANLKNLKTRSCSIYWMENKKLVVQ